MPTPYTSEGAHPAATADAAAVPNSLLLPEELAETAPVAPAIASIYRNANTREQITLFSDEIKRDIEKALTARTDRGKTKYYVRCFATNKDRPATPEEIVRQGWILKLTREYGYSKNHIGVEFTVPFGRDNSKRADLVVFDKDRLNVPYLIVEVKQTKLKDGKDQLKSYCLGTGAPLGVWSDGGKVSVYHRRDPNYFVELPDLPTAAQTIEDIVNEPWTMQTLIDKEDARERNKTLVDIIHEMEDEVLSNAGVDVFEEVFKLIFTKLYDEWAVGQKRYKYLKFRNTNTETHVREAISVLFEEARKKWEGVFPATDRIKLSGSHLVVCVAALEEYKLFNSNLDVVDEAFEYLINQTSKGEKGQYFTPRWVIDMCVKMMNPKEHETVIDTACGSAGFTMHSIFHVWLQILKEAGLNQSHLFTIEQKPPRCQDYVRD